MEKWRLTALILCGFGLFKEFRPSEPYFTEYLIHYKNVTAETLVNEAYPISTYSYLGTLAIVFLVTDFLRYRSIVILEGFAYVATWVTIIWGPNLTTIKIVETLYGLACSTEVAYYTYIYAKVDREHYKKVTSYTYSAIFFGRFLAGVFAQILVSTKLMNYHELNYISLCTTSIALGISLFLPPVDQSMYFYRQTPTGLSFTQRVKEAYPILWKDFKEAYSNSYVVKWSLWWAIATSGHLQVINYIQPLWESIHPYTDGEIYNGAVEATHTLLSTLLAFGVGHVKLPWSKYGEIFLSLISLLQGVVLFLSAITGNITLAYISYVIFRTLYQVVITVASAEVAEGIREDSYGLIFGINTFVALSVQTILTLIVVDELGLGLSIKTQFQVYGCYYGALGIIFLIVAFVSLFWKSESTETNETTRNLRDDTEE